MNLQAFIDERVAPYLEVPGNDQRYPVPLVEEMAKMGLFGLNVPRRFGGLEYQPAAILEVMEELSRGWLCLPSIVGSHLRITAYLLQAGSPEQQIGVLPDMAAGRTVWAHAYNERRQQLRTSLRDGRLNGTKDWVTNAVDAGRILVVACEAGGSLSAVMVDPGRPEVEIEDLPRPGLKGVSLCRISFSDYPVQDSERIAGVDAVLKSSPGPKALAFAARAVGAGRASAEECRRLVGRRSSSQPLHDVALLRWGRLQLELQSMQAVYRSALAGESDPVVAKVFCSEALRRLLDHAMNLAGGDGYAGAALGRTYQDAIALVLAGTPNDVLVSRLAARTL